MFSQRAEIPAVFTFDHAPALNIPPQIHIKVCLLKEMLGKYILKLSVTSLSRHQLEEEKEEEEEEEEFLQISPCNLRHKPASMFNLNVRFFRKHDWLQTQKAMLSPLDVPRREE